MAKWEPSQPGLSAHFPLCCLPCPVTDRHREAEVQKTAFLHEEVAIPGVPCQGLVLAEPLHFPQAPPQSSPFTHLFHKNPHPSLQPGTVICINIILKMHTYTAICFLKWRFLGVYFRHVKTVLFYPCCFCLAENSAQILFVLKAYSTIEQQFICCL